MTSVCSVASTWSPIPWQHRPRHHLRIIADEMAIGVVNNKDDGGAPPPRAWARPGRVVALRGLLGDAIVMDVSKFSSAASSHSVAHPAPIQSLA